MSASSGYTCRPLPPHVHLGYLCSVLDGVRPGKFCQDSPGEDLAVCMGIGDLYVSESDATCLSVRMHLPYSVELLALITQPPRSSSRLDRISIASVGDSISLLQYITRHCPSKGFSMICEATSHYGCDPLTN